MNSETAHTAIARDNFEAVVVSETISTEPAGDQPAVTEAVRRYVTKASEAAALLGLDAGAGSYVPPQAVALGGAFGVIARTRYRPRR